MQIYFLKILKISEYWKDILKNIVKKIYQALLKCENSANVAKNDSNILNSDNDNFTFSTKWIWTTNAVPNRGTARFEVKSQAEGRERGVGGGVRRRRGFEQWEMRRFGVDNRTGSIRGLEAIRRRARHLPLCINNERWPDLLTCWERCDNTNNRESPEITPGPADSKGSAWKLARASWSIYGLR